MCIKIHFSLCPRQHINVDINAVREAFLCTLVGGANGLSLEVLFFLRDINELAFILSGKDVALSLRDVHFCL